MTKLTRRVFALLLLIVSQGTRTITSQQTTRTIAIHARRFAFSPAEITLKKGETVTLALTSDDVTHSLVVEGLAVKGTITKDHTTNVTVTPEQAGDFRGRCGHFCGRGHGAMTFIVHVTDN